MGMANGMSNDFAGLGLSIKNPVISVVEMDEIHKMGLDSTSYKPQSDNYVAPGSTTKRVAVKWKESASGKKHPYPWHTLADVLQAASTTFGVTIIADDYMCRDRNTKSLRTTFPDNAEEALTEIEREFNYEREPNADYVCLRSKTWYLDEASEVPKQLVLRWAAIRKQQDGLQFKDYVEIAGSLTNQQVAGLFIARIDGPNPFAFDVMAMGEHVERLRLCSTFSADQMESAFSDGLTYRAMSPEQRTAFADMLHAVRPGLTDDKLPSFAFAVRQTSDQNTRSSFTYNQDSAIFTYIFAPGDRKEFTMIMRSKLAN
jgi:hypothetical protein